MSFRKRNVGLSNSHALKSSPNDGRERELAVEAPRYNAQSSTITNTHIAGVRPSALDGRPTTSTGTQSLDHLLAGHGGLALGNSIVLEESGTTDYAGTLLRYYAAEGIVQGHQVHVIGVGEQWGRDLPGLVGGSLENDNDKTRAAEIQGKMKIAWRYEKLGEFGVGGSGPDLRAPRLPDRTPIQSISGDQQLDMHSHFCHSFDLTKRLTLPNPGAINFIPVRTTDTQASPFTKILEAISQKVSTSKPNIIHRIIIPAILSPAFYPPRASSPQHILQFLHSLRSLLRQYSTQLSVMISLPLTLYPRATGLVRWLELLSDGVIELVPFPHAIDTGPSITTSGAATAQEEKPQGMVNVHRLPVFHERGGGGVGRAGVGDDLAFTVSRRKFVIKPFSLPPVEGDTDAQTGDINGSNGAKTKIDIEF